jgi:hypothetical protein
LSTVYSARLDADVHMGKRDAQPPGPQHIRWSDLISELDASSIPKLPSSWGHGYALGGGEDPWGMLANGPCDDGTIPTSWYAYNGVGDCAVAGPGHEEMEGARLSGRSTPRFTCLSIADWYAVNVLGLSGARAITADNDEGSDVQTVLQLRQSRGLLDVGGVRYKIGQTFVLDGLQEIWEAAYVCDVVGIGVQLQQEQMNQFDAGQPWDYVASGPGATVIGGHYIPIMGPSGLITWGKRQGYTQAFIEHQVDEAYAWLDAERLTVAGLSAEGMTQQQVVEYMQSVISSK